MAKALLKTGLAFTVLLLLPILLIRAQPTPPADLPAFLIPTADCPTLCFMGIRPGTTTMSEAVDLLRANPWVKSMKLEEYQLDLRGVRANGWLSWRWSGAAGPQSVDVTRPGRIYFAQADRLSNAVLVESIAIPTVLRTYQTSQWFGEPASGMAAIANDKTLNYLIMYPPAALPSWIRVSTVLHCPASLLDYWNSRAEITLTTAPITGDYTPFVDVVRLC